MLDYIEIESLGIELTYSGRACLNLTSLVGWDAFPDFAKKLARYLDASIVHKFDSVDVRIWELSINDAILRLVFDDFPVMVSLESPNESTDAILREFDLKIRAEF